MIISYIQNTHWNKVCLFFLFFLENLKLIKKEEIYIKSKDPEGRIFKCN